MGSGKRSGRGGRRTLWARLWLAGALAAGAWLFCGRLTAFVVPWLWRTAVVAPGAIVATHDGPALGVRRERLIRTPAAGALQLIAAEGERVPAGFPVVAVDGMVVRAPEAGVISYVIDGLEGALLPGDLLRVVAGHPERFRPRYRRLADGDPVAAGDAVFRLVDNFTFYIYAALPGSPSLQPGDAVTVRLSPVGEVPRPSTGEDGVISAKLAREPFRARVAAIERDPRRTGVVLTVGRFIHPFLSTRQWRIRVERTLYRGLLVPRRSLVERAGRTGVFVLEDDRPAFRPVQVIGTDARRAAVSGLAAGLSVITNPAWVIGGE